MDHQQVFNLLSAEIERTEGDAFYADGQLSVRLAAKWLVETHNIPPNEAQDFAEEWLEIN